MTSRPSGETAPPRGPVSVLDIGGDIGAAVVLLDQNTASGELYACPRRAPERHLHTGVHRRRVGDAERLVAIFPELRQGEWSLLLDGVEHTPFAVEGGRVTELSI